MGGELRVDSITAVQQAPGAGLVGQVRGRLAGENGVALVPLNLAQLDFGIPIGALHQAHRHSAPRPAGKIDQPVEHLHGPLLVRLHGDAKAFPAVQLRVRECRLDQVQGQIQPIRLLGIKGEADVAGLGGHRQLLQARRQFVQRSPPVGEFIAGMERRKLHRNAWAGDRAAPGGGLADFADGVEVGLKVAVGIGHRACRLAQHVVGVGIALALLFAGAADGGVDGAPQNELPSHDAHGLGDGGAHHRLPQAGHGLFQKTDTLLPAPFVEADQLAGQQKAPSGGVHKQRVAVAQMRGPVPAFELVANEPIGGAAVGDAQQRFRQAHQHHSFLSGKGEFVQQFIQPAPAGLRRPNAHNPAAGAMPDSGLGDGIQVGDGQKPPQHLRLVTATLAADGLAP